MTYIEAEAIPYDPARLRGERLLVLAPHPDDEVIACGGLIAQHLEEGRVVRVVVVTDGAEAAGGLPPDDYRAVREAESREGLSALGEGIQLHFLGLPDRGLDGRVAALLRHHLIDFRPDLVCVPSPIEIHPDHLALARAFCELLQGDASLASDFPLAVTAFYEVSQPLRPNALVDISAVAERKYAAVAAHASQLAIRDYLSFARGLNAYRAMTLPREVTFAEAYRTVPMSSLHTTPFSELRRLCGAPPAAEVVRETLPVTVVVRTKDRPALLREAIDSIRANAHPAAIVVVNDGGAPVDLPEGVAMVRHERPRGRSEAMNSGVRAAATTYVAFLDDDDRFYPEHISTLAAAATASPASAAWYSDSVSTFFAVGSAGTYEPRQTLRMFGRDFDGELLLIDNYIPLPTILTTREAFLEAGGFDPGFDLFEDWDFLIRLSQRAGFTHVPRITCEVRHFLGGDSILLASPQGSHRFREAKLQVWQKHAALMSNHLIADVFERQKKSLLDLNGSLVEEKGRRSHAETDISRLERDKTQLFGEIQSLHNEVNGRVMLIRDLEARMEVLKARIEVLEADLRRVCEKLEDEKAARAAVLAEVQTQSDAVRAAYAEIERLQGVLDMIYRSNTWRLHTLVERMRGRG